MSKFKLILSNCKRKYIGSFNNVLVIKEINNLYILFFKYNILCIIKGKSILLFDFKKLSRKFYFIYGFIYICFYCYWNHYLLILLMSKQNLKL